MTYLKEITILVLITATMSLLLGSCDNFNYASATRSKKINPKPLSKKNQVGENY